MGVARPRRQLARAPTLQVPANDLDGARNRKRDPECEQEALPGRRLERVAAEVPEQRGVEGPAECRRRVENHEPSPRVSERTGAQSDDCAASRDEAGDQDQLSASLADLLLSPIDALSTLFAAEEAVVDPGAEAVSDVIRRAVAEER